jgi:hypothetical protein
MTRKKQVRACFREIDGKLIVGTKAENLAPKVRLTALYTLITGVWMGFTIQIISVVFPATLITAKFGK